MRNHRSSRVGRMSVWLGIIVAAAAVLIALLIWQRGAQPNGNGGGNAGGGKNGTASPLLSLTRTALAATENLETDEAEDAWASLREQLPQDESIALNHAINRVLRVDQLSAQATNAALGDEEKKAARRQLAVAIPAARESIEDYATVTTDNVMPRWLQARIDLHEASLMLGFLTKSQRQDVYTRLSAAINGEIGKDARSIMLGGTLIGVVQQMEDPIDGLPSDLLNDAAKTISALSNQHPDNLFFALRAARLNIDRQDKQAVEFIRRAQSLAAAIEPSIRRETKPIGVTPDELVQQILTAIEENDWLEAETRMLLWFNVLNSTEIVKTDRRRASPHPLDRLSFETLRRLSAEAAADSPLEVGQAPLAFEETRIEGSDTAVAIQPIDFDMDLDLDLVSVNNADTLTLWANQQESNQQAWKKKGEVKLEHSALGLIAADLFVVDSSDPERLRVRLRNENESEKPDYGATSRHETIQNLIAYGKDGVSVIRVDGRVDSDEAVLKVVDTPTGLEDVTGVITAIAGDLEADGDIDLVFATESDGVRMFANRGNRTFFEVLPGTDNFSRDDHVVSMAIADVDRDLDLDIVSLHASGKIALIENLLHLQFRGRALPEIGVLEGANSVSVHDIDGNVSWDLIITGPNGSHVVFSQTADAAAWTVERTESTNQAATNAIIADLNNDSWQNLVSLSESSQTCSLGPWGFGPEGWNPMPGFGSIQSPVAVDLNRDGRIDVAAIDDRGIQLFTNQTDAGHYLDVRFRGIDDNASGRVNHYALGSVLELRFGPHYRAQIVTTPSTHFGIDGFTDSGTLRAILPNGLSQTIRDPDIDSLVEEEQTLKGSCPYLYAWDGEKFVFKTDCLWAAPLGLQVARGVVAKDRPWEYLKIDGSDIRPRGDRYEFRITEELWEVAYFDKVALSVVDHPAGTEICTNEKVGPPQIAEPTIFAFANGELHNADSAVNKLGDDVSKQLARNDSDYVKGFKRRFRQGLCPPHWVDLDFSTAVHEGDRKDSKIYLVLTGWILPTDTSLNIQIDQNPSLGPIEFPSVWVPDSKETDGWRKAIPYTGFPGGKTKTIVVDVTDVLIKEDPRLRVHTSAQIYWDSAKLAIQSEAATFHTESVPLLAAEVTSHGYSKRLRTDPTQPEWYDYQQATTTPRWPPLRGKLSQFGDCTDLVREWDDEMVVISGGDEIRLEFSLPQTKLPEGWVRDFVLHSVGWDKDADLNTLAGQSTMPLPYREMTEYPPVAGGEELSAMRRERNEQHLQRTQSFRDFWHR